MFSWAISLLGGEPAEEPESAPPRASDRPFLFDDTHAGQATLIEGLDEYRWEREHHGVVYDSASRSTARDAHSTSSAHDRTRGLEAGDSVEDSLSTLGLEGAYFPDVAEYATSILHRCDVLPDSDTEGEGESLEQFCDRLHVQVEEHEPKPVSVTAALRSMAEMERDREGMAALLRRMVPPVPPLDDATAETKEQEMGTRMVMQSTTKASSEPRMPPLEGTSFVTLMEFAHERDVKHAVSQSTESERVKRLMDRSRRDKEKRLQEREQMCVDLESDVQHIPEVPSSFVRSVPDLRLHRIDVSYMDDAPLMPSTSCSTVAVSVTTDDEEWEEEQRWAAARHAEFQHWLDRRDSDQSIVRLLHEDLEQDASGALRAHYGIGKRRAEDNIVSSFMNEMDDAYALLKIKSEMMHAEMHKRHERVRKAIRVHVKPLSLGSGDLP